MTICQQRSLFCGPNGGLTLIFSYPEKNHPFTCFQEPNSIFDFAICYLMSIGIFVVTIKQLFSRVTIEVEAFHFYINMFMRVTNFLIYYPAKTGRMKELLPCFCNKIKKVLLNAFFLLNGRKNSSSIGRRGENRGQFHQHLRPTL